MSRAALFPSRLRLPLISPEDTEDSETEISLPTGTKPCSEMDVAVARSRLDPAMGPGPFWPKK